MSDESAVALRPSVGAVAVNISDEELRVLRDVLNPSLTAAELRLTAAYANKTGLDPIAKQFYPAKAEGRLTFITSIDGFRIIAERSGRYDGQDAPVYAECACGEAPPRHPEWCEVTVYRKDWSRGLTARAYWHEYKPEPGPTGKGDRMWKRMPHVMLAKVAEALALRKAFPNDLSGLYTGDEMDQAGAHDAPRAPRTVAEAPVAVEAPEDVPALPEGPSGALEDAPPPFRWTGDLISPPDGLRMTKVSWLGDQVVAKVELPIRIGRGKHTIMVTGPLAEPVAATEWAEGDRISVDADLSEVEWAKDKPKKKELRHVRGLALMRGGEWQHIATAAVEEAPPEALPLPVEDPFADESVIPGEEQVAWERLTRWGGTAGATFDTEDAWLASSDPGRTPDGREYQEVRLVIGEEPRLAALGVMASGEWHDQRADEIVAGQRVRVLGTWAARRSGPAALVITALMAA